MDEGAGRPGEDRGCGRDRPRPLLGHESDEVQRKWFIRQLELAKEVNLPVIIHSREASQETFDIMKEHHAGSTGGVIHCYSGSKEMAAEYLKMGYYIGIGGVVTFKNARVMKEVAAAVPLERILIETDCPYLAPRPTEENEILRFSSLCHRRDCEAQRNCPQNGGGDHLGKCNEDV